MQRSTSAMFLFFITTTIGCGQLRGIPSHGGGKRFDEEQRVVASAIRHSVAVMNLSELTGRRVQITVDGMASDGGGTVAFPGITHLGAGVSGGAGTGNLVQINQSVAAGPRLTNDNYNTNISGNAGIGYNPMLSYAPHLISTAADMHYLRATVEMKAVHAGLLLVSGDPEIILHVLVDVLGTNRSRTELLVSNSEVLAASCEATYYAQEAKSGRLIFEARRISAASQYREIRALGMSTPIIDRTVEQTPPTLLPVDEGSPTSQPAAAQSKSKNWLDQMLTRIVAD